MSLEEAAMLRGRRKARKRAAAAGSCSRRVEDAQPRAAFARDFAAALRADVAALTGFGLAGFVAVSPPLAAATALPASSFADVSVDLSLAASLGSVPAFSTRFRFVSFLFLKSVSYQPLPFKRNCGAETSRFSCDLPHSGHLRSGASVIFCSASTSCPQALHRYS